MNPNLWAALGGAPVTLACIGASVAYYVYLVLVSGGPGGPALTIPIEVLMAKGASYPEGVWGGGWQRFVLPMFMHVNLWHIILNMYSLVQLGPAVEAHFGFSNFGTIYLLSGVGGICMSLLLGGHVSAGASTCLFGILGAYLAVKIFACWDWRRAWKNADVRQTAFWIGLNFAIVGLAFPNVDSWGHLGGLISGLLYGGLFEYWRKRRSISLTILVFVLSLTAGAVALSRWTFYSPAYYVWQGLQAEEAGRTDEAQAQFQSARAWGRHWRSEHAGVLLYAAAYHAQEAGNLAQRDEYLGLLKEVSPRGFFEKIVRYKE